MEVRASELMSGKRIHFESKFYDTMETWFLLWNKKRTQYEIVDANKPTYAFWWSDYLFPMVKKMNSMTGKYDTAVDDSKEWLNTTGATVDWKKRTRKFFSRKHK